MKKNKPQLSISLSREHAKNETAIRGTFKDFDVNVHADYMRFSAEELAMQVIIFLTKSFIESAAWDLFRFSIKKLFKKFPKTDVVVRDTDSILYSIRADFTINIVVTPDRIKEYEHIKTLDDLIKYLELKNNEK